MNVDGWKQTAETDQVLLVVTIVRVPIGLGARTKIGVVNADFEVFLVDPAELLVDVTCRN